MPRSGFVRSYSRKIISRFWDLPRAKMHVFGRPKKSYKYRQFTLRVRILMCGFSKGGRPADRPTARFHGLKWSIWLRFFLAKKRAQIDGNEGKMRQKWRYGVAQNGGILGKRCPEQGNKFPKKGPNVCKTRKNWRTKCPEGGGIWGKRRRRRHFLRGRPSR